MKLFSFAFIIVSTVTLASCVTNGGSIRLEEVRSSLNCVTYKDGIEWQQIRGLLGDTQINPIPPRDAETKNSRIYTKNQVIFYTDLKRINQDGESSYKEVVTSVEICVKK